MKKKKWPVVLGCVLLVAALGAGVFFALPSILVRNVFDEMYYALKQEPEVGMFMHGKNSYYYTDTSFYNVAEITKDAYGKARFYTQPFVPENQQISVSNIRVNGQLEIGTTIWFEREKDGSRGLLIDYTYHTKSKALECEMKIYDSITPLDGEHKIDRPDLVIAFLEEYNITRAQIEEYKHFLLYERVLTDWFAGNAAQSRYSMESLGRFALEDNTYVGLEGWAG